MERDCGIAHGMSGFLKERMNECSDKYICHICDDCGSIASKKRNMDVYHCNQCNTYNTSKVEVPYAFKLMTQELGAINIGTKINTTNTNK